MTIEMGLRERKRLAAMRRIQEVALDLFDRDGYQQVSIERIAEAAEVSPSSVYRYFGTKEQIILWDEYDPVAIERLAEELLRLPMMTAIRQVLTEVLGEMLRLDEDRVRRRIHYMMQEPAVAAATAVQGHDFATLLIARFAEQRERDETDMDLYLMAHGFVGAVIGAMRYWYAAGFQVPLSEIIDRLLAIFESGYQPAEGG